MEIVEVDAIDSEKQEERPVQIVKPAPVAAKPPAPKPTPAPAPTEAPTSKKMEDWQIIVNATDETQWVKTMVDAAMLDIAGTQSRADLKALWQINRPLFDRLKQEDKVQSDHLLDAIRIKQETFKE